MQSVSQPPAHPPGEFVRRARRVDEEHPWLLDSLLVVLVLLLGAGAVRAGVPSDVFGRRVTSVPVAVVVATAVAQTLPLAWQRKAPLTVFWVVLAVCLFQVSLRLALRTDISLMIALYGVACYAPVRRRSVLVLAGAGTVTAVVLVIFRVPHLQHNTAFVLFFLCCAALAATGLGLARRARQAQLIAMSDRAARLETERDQRAKIATATERARISREMHDIVGHNLGVIIGLADGGAALAPANPERAAEAMRLIAATGRQALGELRLTLGALREDPPGEAIDAEGASDTGGARGASGAGEPELRPQPDAADLPGLLDRIRAAGPRVTYTTSGDLAALTPGQQLAVYRIVQEALTNVLRHAGTRTTVQVTLHADAGFGVGARPDAGAGAGPVPGPGPRAGQVRISVEDTGPPGERREQRGGYLAHSGGNLTQQGRQPPHAGGSPGQAGGPQARTDDEHNGQGLTGIRERASLLGGTAQAGPRPGGGWAVYAVLPMPPARAVSSARTVPPDSTVPVEPIAPADRGRQ